MKNFVCFYIGYWLCYPKCLSKKAQTVSGVHYVSMFFLLLKYLYKIFILVLHNHFVFKNTYHFYLN